MTLNLRIGEAVFPARLETATAPTACAAFLGLAPQLDKVVHARWSGEAVWAPLGETGLILQGAPEPATGTPAPGQVLLYPGGVSETEILIVYGAARFACSAGPLEGVPVATITEGLDRLAEIGREVLWRGAMRFRVS
jgi:hypothetical protein